MSNILVTVYIPTYNRVELLKRAIDSVLNQTYKNIEVIVVDDCSSDNTIEYLNNLVKKDLRVRFFQNTINCGACVSRNKAILEAKGEFITGLDDDDYFLADRIEQFIISWKVLYKKESDLICLFSNILIKKFNSGKNNYKKIRTISTVSRKKLLISNWIGNQVFTKTDYIKNILFDEKLKMWQDLDCWYRLLEKGKAIKIDNSSYVMDISHEHERISLSKITKIYDTFNYLAKKYDLSNKDKSILEGQILNYDTKIFTVKKIFLLFLEHRNLKVLVLLLFQLIKRTIK